MKHPNYADLKQVARTAFQDAKEKQGFSDLQAFAYSFDHLGIYVDGDDPSERVFALTALFMTALAFRVPHSQDPDYRDYVLEQLKASYEREAANVVREVGGLLGNEELSSDIRIVQSAYDIIY
jgi:hypothetical protein